MALLLYPWRRRLHSKILPNELSSRRCHFAVPTASSSNLIYGLLDLHHGVVSGSLASGLPIVPQLATIFMLRCDRIPIMLNLITTIDRSHCANPESGKKQAAHLSFRAAYSSRLKIQPSLLVVASSSASSGCLVTSKLRIS